VKAAAVALSLALLLVLAALPVAAPGSSAAAEPSAERVYELVDTISDWYRYLDTPGHHAAEAFIAETMEGYGLEVYRQEFTVNQGGQQLDAVNVVGYYEGKDPNTWLVLGGHYDATISSDSGAYDNAVGTATVLELARYFTQEVKTQPEISLVFGAWDSEEEGGQGSQLFVESAGGNATVLANLNFDMFGLSYPIPNRASLSPLCDEEFFKLYLYTSPVEDFSGYADYEYDNQTRANFSMLRKALEQVAYDELALPPEWVLAVDDTETNSDQRSFIRAGIPAIWFRGMHEYAWEEGDACEQTFKHFSTDRLESLELIAGSHANLLAGFQTGLDIAAGLVTELAYGDPAAPAAGKDGGGVAETVLALLVIAVAVAGVAVLVRWRQGRQASP
jgi:hypothetical protein